MNPREESRRIYFGPMAADYDPGPGKVNHNETMRRMSEGRPATWRDKHWTQW